jgi:sugar lactone lactonase YvrE
LSSIFVALLALCCERAPAMAQDVLGVRPTYSDRALSTVPNQAAIDLRIWMPGLDAGYVPQGLTVIAGEIYVGAYRSVAREQSTGPCRVFRIDVASGKETGYLDLPAGCGHAGGLARGPGRRLWVADTRTAFEVEMPLPESGARRSTIGRVVRTLKLGDGVRGSFVAGDGNRLWLGAHAREGAPEILAFEIEASATAIATADIKKRLPVPLNAQGAAFDRSGALWITRSGARFGELVKLDPKTGQELARYPMPAGIEDISFDAEGRLWSVSEAGSRRWLDWPTFYPVIFRFDVARLTK